MNLGRTPAATVDVHMSSAGPPLALMLVALISACAPAVHPTSPAAPGGPTPETHATDPASTSEEPTDATDPASSPAHLTVTPGPPLAELQGWTKDDHGAALEAFRRSCAVATSRTDTSGLTQPSDWLEACAAAATATTGTARELFEQHFSPVVVDDGTGLHTGYYEPEIEASRTKYGRFRHPIYKRPSDLVVVASDAKGPVRYCARWDGTRCVPYFSRAEIEDGALSKRRLEIAYAADPYELYFMQMQGSGRLRMPDGSLVRVGFDGTNGRKWVSIAPKVKKELNGRDWPLDTDGILAWLRANPKRARVLLREDPSFVFFREIREPTDGPLGAIRVPLTAGRSLAADPKFIPLGAPVWLISQVPSTSKGAPPTPLARLFVAQDTGGAIRGPNRFDVFFGTGTEARAFAGKMFHRGQAIVLLPAPAVARLFGSKATAR
jgi:membrane-bound lytic murein transglycosylase A